MFTDSHCHLNYKGLVEDQAATIARACRIRADPRESPVGEHRVDSAVADGWTGTVCRPPFPFRTG